MKRATTALLFLVSLVTACERSRRLPTDPTPQDPTPPKFEERVTTTYSLTSTLTSISIGVPCGPNADMSADVGIAEQHTLTVQRGETTATLLDDDGSYWGPFEYRGTLTGRDFKYSTGGRYGVRCLDGTAYEVINKTEIEGRFSEDWTILTATLRYSWWQSKGDPSVHTSIRTWEAIMR
jgi:hypothetical protein